MNFKVGDEIMSRYASQNHFGIVTYIVSDKIIEILFIHSNREFYSRTHIDNIQKTNNQKFKDKFLEHLC